MLSSKSADNHPLVRKLQSIGALDREELEAVRQLPIVVRDIRRGHDIVREGDRPLQCCVVMEGFTLRYKVIEEGKRQILSFHTPGDIPDLQSLHLKVMDHSLAALSPMKAGFVQHADMRDLCLRYPRITSLLWRDTLIDGAIFREWLTGVGRRDATTRIAHLFCEVYARLDAIGLTEDGAARFPITQVELSDALGLTDVHVNRSLSVIKAQGLLSIKGGTLTIIDWDRLKVLGHFDPTYLHIDPAAVQEPV